MATSGMGGLSSPISISGSGIVNIDCKYDISPHILFTPLGASTLNLTRLMSNTSGKILINGFSDRDVSISNSSPNPVPILIKGGTKTLIDFFYDGSIFYCNSSVREISYQFPFYETSFSSSLAVPYNISCMNGEMVSVFLRGSVSIANSSVNYWRFTLNDSQDSQAAFTFDTKNWTTANTISYVSRALSTRLSVFGGSMKLASLVKVGSPGNLSVSVLRFTVYQI